MGISSIGGGGGSAFQNAALGISRGVANVDRDTQIVAGAAASGDPDAAIGALIDSKAQSLNVAASAKAMSILDRTLGSLIDVKV